MSAIECDNTPINTRASLLPIVTECDYDRFRTGTKTGSELGVKFLELVPFSAEKTGRGQGGNSSGNNVYLSHGTFPNKKDLGMDENGWEQELRGRLGTPVSPINSLALKNLHILNTGRQDEFF